MKIGIIYSRGAESGSFLRGGYIEKSLKKLGHNVEFIKPMKRLKFQLDFPISLFVYTLKILFKKYDVVFAMKPFPNACIPALIHKFFHKSLAILDDDDLDYAYRTGIMSKVNKLITSPFPKYFDIVTTHNKNMKEYLTKNLKAKEVWYLNQGVDFSIFNKENIKSDILTNLNSKLIVYTAHLDVSTDLDSIFKAFRIVCSKLKDVKLVIVGGGPHQKYFENLAKEYNLEDKIIFTGYVKNTLMPSYINKADVCIVYYNDNLANKYRVSMKLREYLTMGKTTVCNSFGDLKLFEKFTYQSKTDIQDFANKIIYVLTHKTDNRSLNGRKFVLKNYSWDNIAKEFNNKLNGKIHN